MVLSSLFFKEFERMAGEAVDICLRVLKESNKSRFDSYSVRNSVLRISHITFRDCRVHIFPTTFFEIAVYKTRESVLKQCPTTGNWVEEQSSSFERLCIVSNEFETLSEVFVVVLQKNNNFEFCAN